MKRQAYNIRIVDRAGSAGMPVKPGNIRKKRNSLRQTAVFIFLAILIQPGGVWGASARDLVRQGNAAYAQKKYDQALDAYEKAAEKQPDSPQILYNKGTALYRKGNYSQAAQAFRQAAEKAEENKLRAYGRFNQGNSHFQVARQMEQSNPKAALKEYGSSVQNYHSALTLQPNLKESAENIEIARKAMQTVMEKLQQQQQADRQRQQQQQEAAQNLQEMIQKQSDLQRQSEREQQKMQVDRKGASSRSDQLAREQKQLQDQTEKMMRNPSTAGSFRPEVKKNLEDAVRSQKQAAENLRKQQPGKAADDQHKAVDHLQKALDSLKGRDDNTDRKTGAGDTQKKKGEKQAEQQPPDARQKSQPDRDRMASPPENQFSDDADDILNEERENANHRRKRFQMQYKGVERDW